MEGPGLKDLPAELDQEILLFLPIRKMLDLCRVDKAFASICRDENLWLRRIKNDYDVTIKPSRFPLWREFYMAIYEGKIVNLKIALRGEIVGSVWMNKDATVSNLADEIAPLIGYRPPMLIFIKHNGDLLYQETTEEPDKDELIFGGYSGWLDPSGTAYVEATDDHEENAMKIRYENKEYFFFSRQETTTGEFVDFVKKIYPKATTITYTTFGRSVESVMISGDPAKRSRNLLEMFYELIVDRTRPITIT